MELAVRSWPSGPARQVLARIRRLVGVGRIHRHRRQNHRLEAVARQIRQAEDHRIRPGHRDAEGGDLLALVLR